MSVASAPFPASAAAALRAGRVDLIPERNEFIPPWYKPHKNQSTVVKQSGDPIEPGFTVEEMLPERRWAVSESGELLPQLEFQELYLRKLSDWFLYASPEAQQGNPRRPPSTFNPHREPVPNVRDYVAMKLDPRDPRKILPMAYDPNATRGARSNRLWDSTNERFLEGPERVAALVEAYRIEQGGGRRTLRPDERLEVEEHLAGRSLAGAAPLNATQAKLEVLTELLREGEITQEQYAERVASIFGGSKAAEPMKASRRGHRLMPCGVEVVNNMQRHHVDTCTVCTEADLK